MFHVRVSQSPNSPFVAFTVVFLALMHSCRGQLQVVGPSEPVFALVGQDVILPCYLNPAMNALEMTVEWARPDLDPRFVFVWRDGVELKSKKHPLYKGRTSLFTDELKNGNISMKLSKVNLSDAGEYRCFIPNVGESKVQLVVGAVSSPVVNTTITNSTVLLQCEAEGWYPEPEVFWLDGEGNLLSAGPTETVRGPDDLYTVSRRLTVEKSDSFTCRVQQKIINQTRETHFNVPDHFFVVPSTSNQHVVVGSVIGCAALMVILAAVFVLWKWKQRKSKNKTTSPEDGAEQTEEGKTITSKSENKEFQIEMEEGESLPLMAAREEKNNEDNRGEQIQSQSEHKDAEFVMERETHQDQLRTKPEPVNCNQDMDVTGGEKIRTSMNNEEVTLIPTQETRRHQSQDNLLGKQVKNDRDKSEGEKRIKPVKEDSGLPVVLVHTDQEVQKEEETQQEQLMEERQPGNDVDEEEVETKKEKKKERAEQKGSGLKKKPENQRERRKQKAERQKMENKRKRELELERRREGVKDGTEVKPQQRHDQHLFEDKTQEESKTEERMDKKGNDREGNQSEFMRTTERTAENQEGPMKENLKETKDDREEHGQQLPSVSREVTERPNLKIHEETAERKNKEVQEENELQTEKQQEETKEQPERSTKAGNVEFKERQSDKGADDDETQRTSKETEKQEDLQAAKEETREQTWSYFKFEAERGVKEQEGQEEEMEVDPTPDTEKYQRKKQHEQRKQLRESQQQSARRKRRQDIVPEEQSVEVKKTHCTEQQVIHEPQRWDLNSRPVSQEEEEYMDL